MEKKQPKPTEAELQILAVLWRVGPATVRQIHDELGRDTGYTTVLKLMQIMAEKGLLLRDEQSRSHVYRPATPRDKTQNRLIGELVERAFDGSVQKLMIAALSAERASPQDLEEIRKLIESELQSRGKGGKPS
jgi:predicted transcriptional regulator